MKGRAMPLLMSTTMLLCPMSMDLRFRPELASLLSLLRSGSRGCSMAMACQSTPKSPMALTTHCRSAREASSRAEGVVGEGFVDGCEFELVLTVELTRELASASASASAGADGRVEDSSTEFKSEISSFGLERASATTLAFPFRYRISVVYSEIHASWYV